MVLLIQRKHGPFEGVWALPGGFVEMEETLKYACQRELFEETGIKDVDLNQFYTFDAVNRDPRHRTHPTSQLDRHRIGKKPHQTGRVERPLLAHLPPVRCKKQG